MSLNFGEFLKQKRQEKNLTQKQLANKLFISESAVCKWEKNIAHPDITLLTKLSEILEVSEHELITASIDKEARLEKSQAKKWRNLKNFWNMFFYISYAIAILTCFIVNLAVSGTLSWFWIVLSSLIVSFSFTNFHQYIKKFRLILIPLSMFLSVLLLLGVCAIYTGGNWFPIPAFSILFGLIIIFAPIYIAKYPIFSKLKKYNNFISLFVDFIALNLLLIVINIYTAINNYSTTAWYFTLGLPISLCVYLILNLYFCIGLLKFNKLVKTSMILFFSNILYLLSTLIKSDNPKTQEELNDLNFFNANLSVWRGETAIEQNIHLIIFLSIFVLAIVFLISGIILHLKKRRITKLN